MIDLAEILRKYIAHVRHCEGNEFIHAIYRETAGDASVFSDEEWAALREAAGEPPPDAYEVEIWQEKLADHAEGEREMVRAVEAANRATYERARAHVEACGRNGHRLVSTTTLAEPYEAWLCACGAAFRHAEGNS